MSSLFVLRRREDKGGPIHLLFPIAKLMTGWRGGVEAGKKEHGLILKLDALL
jgi:hypothetical protein